MNRKQKIIVSITGIVIVVLALLGLTYAYFVTTIQGNDSDKSIEVTTANLRLVYRDGNGSITASNIMPGTEISSKEFNVTNEGNAESSYITVFENVLYTDTKTDPVTQINSFQRQEDLKYTLTCKQYNASDVETGTCNGVTETIFPNATTMSLIVSNKIPVGYVHKYVLTLNYIEAGVDQSEDMGKSLSAKVNIKDVRMSNPYATIGGTAENPVEEANGTLAYNIINNAKLNKNGTSLVNVPLTKPAEEVSNETEKELSVTQDDYGTSYYYRGGVENNYINFAGMCFRIVRIEGDGSTKLILEDSSHECNSASYTGNWTIGETVAFGFDNNSKADFLNYTGGLADNLSTYQSTLTTKVSDKYSGKTITDYLKADEWCFDNSVTSTESFGYDDDDNVVYNESEATNGWYTDEYYGAYTRIYTDKKPSLKCSGTKLTSFKDNTPMYVGTLTADEIIYAGAKGDSTANRSYYLLNSYANTNFLYWWALSPSYFNARDGNAIAFNGVYNGDLIDNNVGDVDVIVARGAVTLSSSVEILTGDGTKNNPYTLK